MGKKIYVRIQKKKQQKQFFRCGMSFSQNWLEIDGSDTATVAALKADQMLEVSETLPADFNQDDVTTETKGNADDAGKDAGKVGEEKAADGATSADTTTDGDKTKPSETDDDGGKPATADPDGEKSGEADAAKPDQAASAKDGHKADDAAGRKAAAKPAKATK